MTVEDSDVPVAFTEDTRTLLDGKNFATVATLNPDGSPQTSVVWIARDGDAVLFSTTAERRKARNLARDPRVSMSVFDLADPYRSVAISGTAELVEDRTKELPGRLSRHYLGEDAPADPEGVTRLIVRIVPERVTGFAG
ncbi:PPOX class F420-dependent oxidoreductase [Streptomyces avicenniae]|uniref:PPOX class F420-dependent oxidoreductase n=1 Tax=Streptomyces avicenniae TaxID=500153 RepID=UPI000A67511A|nr:PPOX class F420-dependent oxidoreductase [Streptomyces avicenniae]